MGKILFYVAIFIVLHLLIVLNINSIQIKQASLPLGENPRDYFPPVLYPLAGFDGAHYILIAKSGYGQFQQAFFPLYPLLINTLSKLFNFNVLLSGIIISWGALLLGLIFFKKVSEIVMGDNYKSIWAILFLLSFPSAFFYLTVYPESLFLFLSTATLYFIFKKNYLLASIFAFFTSLTKIQGVFLFIPFFFSLFEFKELALSEILKQIKQHYRKLFIALVPLYGLAAYSFYLFINYGDPFYYYHAQDAFGAERTSQGLILLPQVLFRYAKILLTADVNFQYWIAVLELSIFTFVFTVLLFDLYKSIKKRIKNFNYLSLNLYSIAILILPTLTGTLSSMPRYALVSFGFFFALAKIKNLFLKILIAAIFAILHLTLFIYFLKGYF